MHSSDRANTEIGLKTGSMTYCVWVKWVQIFLSHLSFFICWFALWILESILSVLFSRASMESSWLSISDWRPRPRFFSLDRPLHISSGWVRAGECDWSLDLTSTTTTNHQKDVLMLTHMQTILGSSWITTKLKIAKELSLATRLVAKCGCKAHRVQLVDFFLLYLLIFVECRWLLKVIPTNEKMSRLCKSYLNSTQTYKCCFSHVLKTVVGRFSLYLSCCRGPCEPPWGVCSASSRSVWMSRHPSTQLQMLKQATNV